MLARLFTGAQGEQSNVLRDGDMRIQLDGPLQLFCSDSSPTVRASDNCSEVWRLEIYCRAFHSFVCGCLGVLQEILTRASLNCDGVYLCRELIQRSQFGSFGASGSFA